jgi:hypothetical protein
MLHIEILKFCQNHLSLLYNWGVMGDTVVVRGHDSEGMCGCGHMMVEGGVVGNMIVKGCVVGGT